MEIGPFEQGVILATLMSSGHFGGDGRQPQVTLRMHERHAPLLEWLHARIPGSRLFGPYHHGGRDYLQFMCRGEALRTGLVPMLAALPWEQLDPHSYGRFRAMLEKYGFSVVSPGSSA